MNIRIFIMLLSAAGCMPHNRSALREGGSSGSTSDNKEVQIPGVTCASGSTFSTIALSNSKSRILPPQGKDQPNAIVEVPALTKWKGSVIDNPVGKVDLEGTELYVDPDREVRLDVCITSDKRVTVEQIVVYGSLMSGGSHRSLHVIKKESLQVLESTGIAEAVGAYAIYEKVATPLVREKQLNVINNLRFSAVRHCKEQSFSSDDSGGLGGFPSANSARSSNSPARPTDPKIAALAECFKATDEMDDVSNLKFEEKFMAVSIRGLSAPGYYPIWKEDYQNKLAKDAPNKPFIINYFDGEARKSEDGKKWILTPPNGQTASFAHSLQFGDNIGDPNLCPASERKPFVFSIAPEKVTISGEYCAFGGYGETTSYYPAKVEIRDEVNKVSKSWDEKAVAAARRSWAVLASAVEDGARYDRSKSQLLPSSGKATSVPEVVGAFGRKHNACEILYLRVKTDGAVYEYGIYDNAVGVLGCSDLSTFGDLVPTRSDVLDRSKDTFSWDLSPNASLVRYSVHKNGKKISEKYCNGDASLINRSPSVCVAP